MSKKSVQHSVAKVCIQEAWSGLHAAIQRTKDAGYQQVLTSLFLAWQPCAPFAVFCLSQCCPLLCESLNVTGFASSLGCLKALALFCVFCNHLSGLSLGFNLCECCCLLSWSEYIQKLHVDGLWPQWPASLGSINTSWFTCLQMPPFFHSAWCMPTHVCIYIPVHSPFIPILTFLLQDSGSRILTQTRESKQKRKIKISNPNYAHRS